MYQSPPNIDWRPRYLEYAAAIGAAAMGGVSATASLIFYATDLPPLFISGCSFNWWLGAFLGLSVLVTLLAVFSEYAGVLGPMVGASRRYDGPMGKSDRAFVLGVLATGVALGWLGAGWVEAVMWLVAALLAYTLVNRVRQGLKEQQSLPSA